MKVVLLTSIGYGELAEKLETKKKVLIFEKEAAKAKAERTRRKEAEKKKKQSGRQR